MSFPSPHPSSPILHQQAAVVHWLRSIVALVASQSKCSLPQESCTSGLFWLLLEAVELHKRPSRYQNYDCRAIRPPWIPSAWLPSLAFKCMLTYSWFRAAWTSKLNPNSESMLALNLRSCPECGQCPMRDAARC